MALSGESVNKNASQTNRKLPKNLKVKIKLSSPPNLKLGYIMRFLAFFRSVFCENKVMPFQNNFLYIAYLYA